MKKQKRPSKKPANHFDMWLRKQVSILRRTTKGTPKRKK